MSVRLYVKLPKAEIEKEGLEKMFADFEPSFTSKIIKERKKGKCRGFGFVTVSTDEVAEEFIAKYNEQTFVYNDEAFKDEDGSEFKLLIEKALPRKKPETPENKEEEKAQSVEKPNIGEKTSAANSSRRSSPKKTKNRHGNANRKPVSVAESIQPDPRWASELSKLKDLFEAQTTNS
jgi:RNA recognition motif-containing protein